MMNAKAICILFFSTGSNISIHSQQDTIERCPLIGEHFYFGSGHLMRTKAESDSTYFGYFVDGNATGFRFLRQFDCPDVFDEQYNDMFEWSIDPDIDSFFFFFSDAQPPPENFHYLRLHGQRGNPPYRLVSLSGYVKGIRDSNKWIVNADVEIISKHIDLSVFHKRQLVFSKTFRKVKKKNEALAF